MRFSVIVAARTGSRRLPGKALLPLGGLPMIRFLLRRIKGAANADDLVVATTWLPADDVLAEAVQDEGVPVFRGPEEDLVARYSAVARELGAEHVVRVTGDCPFTDSETLDHCLDACRASGEFDLATTKTRFPVGIDYEVIRAESLYELQESNRLDRSDKEHLTKYFHDHPDQFRLRYIDPRPEWSLSDRRFTVDTSDDYRFVQRLVQSLGGASFSVAELVAAARNIEP